MDNGKLLFEKSRIFLQENKEQTYLGIILFLSALIIGVEYSFSRIEDTKKNIKEDTIEMLDKTRSQSGVSLKELQINLVDEQEIKNSPKLKTTAFIAGGAIKYSLESFFGSRDDEYVFKNDSNVFSRVVTISEKGSEVKLSEVLAQYGIPELQLRGSRFYGENAELFIFASKGVAVIGKSYTDEVFEIQTFAPMDSSEYLILWGVDYEKAQ